MIRYLILSILFFISTMLPQNRYGHPKTRYGSEGNLLSFSDSASNGMHWRLVGPFRGGRALAAAGIPGNSTTFYFGAVDGGVWKTTNSGLTWEQISDGQTNPSIGSLAIAPSDEKTIYIGTGEADMRSDITYGDGIYKSVDGGKHWEHIGLKDSRHIGRILIDPQNPNIVLAAALGHAYGSNEERGVFKTTDGGKSWKKVLYKNSETGAIDLSWDSKYPEVVYTSLWQAKRTPWSQYPPDEGPGSGLYKSTDEGNTWTEINGNGLPEKQLGRIGLASVDGSQGEKVYALVEANSKESGLYYSDNGGKDWKLKNNDPNIITRMWYFGEIFVDPQNPNIVYIPNRSILRSEDGGKTFTIIKGEPGGDDYHFLWIDPQNDHSMIVASDQGTSVSLDNGATWSSWYNQPTAQFYHVKTDNQFPYRIYGAQQDAGTVSITSRSDFGEITFRDWYPIGAGESGYIAPDPVNPNIIYGGDTYGGLFRYDHITGQSQVVSPWLLKEFNDPMNKWKYRFTWTSPIDFDTNDNKALYFGSQYLLMTTDGGLNWKKVSPDLTYGNPTEIKEKQGKLTSTKVLNPGWGVIYSFAFSPIQKGMIWAGTDDGLLHLTLDYGKNWKNITPDSLAPWSKISNIETSPFDPKTAYIAVDRHRLDDFSPYIYRTKDNGQHWVRINNGIKNLSFVNVVKTDPYKKGLLYAGTETGIYVSFDDGTNWQPLQLNLPTVSVRDLAVHENDLVVATHGRSFWVLDDLTALRQITEKVADMNTFLFEPETAIRIRKSENMDTPLPPEIPHGKNPPTGAIIDYYLKSKSYETIALDIFDRKGDLVRHFSSSDKPEAIEEQPYFMSKWLPKFRALTTHEGLNRFVWNLRYKSGEGPAERQEGPLVLPGNYKINLSVGDKSFSQELKVEMDPRVKATNKELTDQLKLALSIWNSSADKNKLKFSVDSVSDQINKLKDINIQDEKISVMINNIKTEVDAIEKNINVSSLSGLQRAVLSADREPTEQMFSGFKQLENELTEVQKHWTELKMKDLKELNIEMKEKELPIIKIPSETTKHIIFSE